MHRDHKGGRTMKNSEFGTGYAYCLGLFLAHAERDQGGRKDDSGRYGAGTMWFYSAGDHLIDLKIPRTLPKKKREEIKAWHAKCTGYRFLEDGQTCTMKDVSEAVEYAKQLLLEWDQHNKVTCRKADWR